MRLALAAALLLAAMLVPLDAHAGCVSQVQADAAVANAAKHDETSYQAAIAKKKLAPVRLQERRWREPLDEPADNADKQPPGLVAVSSRQVNCRHELLEFVMGADHKVYKVTRAPHAVKTQTLDVCTCAERHYQCGGANLGMEGFGYELPKGAIYGGELAIAFDSERVAVRNRTSNCPPPAPPPKSAAPRSGP